MAAGAYLSLVAERQGIIDGGVVELGRERSIEVVKIIHRVVGPRDPVTGRPTGKRAHKPFILHAYLGPATVPLYEALCQQEPFRTWKLVLWEDLEDGTERSYFSIELFYATLSAMTLSIPDPRRPNSARVDQPVQELKFTYRGIEWRHVDAWIVAADTWKTPYLS